jgi:anti-sigma regulatory factor (Ser/Thr protein kinase)
MEVGVCRAGVVREPWEMPFLAEARELATLRRVVRHHLELWGLSTVGDTAELCVTELVTNVIRHVGNETPTRLVLSMSGTRLRIEVRDPDTRALPTLLAARADDESGRGMALVDALADRWGVVLHDDAKVTWCELRTGLASAGGHVGGDGVERAEALLRLCKVTRSVDTGQDGPFNVALAEETAIDVIADLLLWLKAHGCDPDEALDRAQLHCEAETTSAC